MAYTAQISQDQSISIENEGTKSVITLTINVGGQMQAHKATVESGSWLAPPALFQTGSDLLLRFQTNQGDVFFRIHSNQITRLSHAPSLSGARSLSLRPSVASGQMPSTGVATRPLSPPAPISPPAAGFPPPPPPAPPGARPTPSGMSAPPSPPPAPPGASRVSSGTSAPPSPPPVPPRASRASSGMSAPQTTMAGRQGSQPPTDLRKSNKSHENLKWWGIATGVLLLIVGMGEVFKRLDLPVGYSLSCITFMASIAWIMQTARTFWGVGGQLFSWLTEKINLQKDSPFAQLLPSFIFGIFLFLLCGGLFNISQFLRAVESENVKLIIGSGIDWFLWIWISIGIAHFLRSKIILWQETNNTAYHLVPNMGAKTEEVYEYVVKRIQERVPPELLMIERVQFSESGLQTVAEYRAVEQLNFTYGRARVIFRSQQYGKDLYVRWDSYLDFSARRLYFILSVINMAFTHMTRFVVGPVVYDLQDAIRNFIVFLFLTEKESTGGRALESGVTPLDNILFSLNWDYLPSYTIDNLQALEEAVTSSAEKVLDQLAAQSEREEKIEIKIDRSRSRYNRLF